MFEYDNIRVVKLISGEEVVTVLGTSDNNFIFNVPYKCYMSASSQMVLYPWILASDKLGYVDVSPMSIMSISLPRDDIAEYYWNKIVNESDNATEETEEDEIMIKEPNFTVH